MSEAVPRFQFGRRSIITDIKREAEAGVREGEENPMAGNDEIRFIDTPESRFKDMAARGVKFPITEGLEGGGAGITPTPEG